MQVYSSTVEAHKLWYTRGSDVVLIGELELEFPDAGRSRRHREVEIQFDFSHTEIQVRTKWHERQTLAVPSTQVH